MRTEALDFTKPHLLRNDAEYQLAVERITALFDAGLPRHQEEIRFLSALVEIYDREHFAIDTDATPQEIVDFLLQENGLTRAALAEPFGGRSRVSDFFAGKRGLSKAQMAWLHKELGVPFELLAKDLLTA